MPECGAILGQGFDSPHLHQEQQTGLVPGHIRLSSRGKRNYPVNTTAINTKVTMKTSQMRGLFRFIEGLIPDQIHGQSEGGSLPAVASIITSRINSTVTVIDGIIL